MPGIVAKRSSGGEAEDAASAEEEGAAPQEGEEPAFGLDEQEEE